MCGFLGPALIEELDVLDELEPLFSTSDEYPFALVAGERCAYTANCAIRDPRWAEGKHVMALTIHPDDGEKFNLPDGATVKLETEMGSALVALAYEKRMHPGTASVPSALNPGRLQP